MTERREFILNTIRTAGLVSLAGLTWSAYVDEITAKTLILRPPGALKEPDFLATCIKCGMCVEACANRNTKPKNAKPTLILAKTGSNRPIGTPYFIARDEPCYMCPEIPCVPVCPTGALDENLVTTKNKLDINKANMGLAVIDKQSCIAFWGIQCDACYRACPLLEKAITIVYEKNQRTGKHSYMKPVVHADHCTGCGLCELACVTEKPAIFVLPLQVALGKAGDHYIKGWDKEDEKRVKNSKARLNRTDINRKSAIDSLNDAGDLY